LRDSPPPSDQAGGSQVASELRLVVRASRALAAATEVRSGLQAVAQLCVPELADYCRLELLDGKKRILAAEVGDSPAHGFVCAPTPDGIAKAREIPSELAQLGVTQLVDAAIVGNHEIIGTMRLMNLHPRRSLERDGLVVIEQIALAVAAAIERIGLERRADAFAGSLHEALLPSGLPQLSEHHLSAVYEPGLGNRSGGDWYDAFPLASGEIAVSVGDVADHGLAAAATMASVRESLRVAAPVIDAPSAVLASANETLLGRNCESLVTALFGRYDPAAGTFRYAVAGHPAPALATPGDSVHELPAGGGPLGDPERNPSTDWTFALPPGSLLVMYTDGLVENERDARVGEKLLFAAIAEEMKRRSADPAAALVRALIGEEPPRDDVAVLTLAIADHPLQQLSSTFSAVPLAAPIVRHALRRFIEASGLDAEKSFALQTAVGEAVANAVEHAYRETTGLIHVRTVLTASALTVSVEDHGGWQPPCGSEERGRGLPLMRALMDDVEVRTSGKTTAVHLTVHLGNAPPPA